MCVDAVTSFLPDVDLLHCLLCAPIGGARAKGVDFEVHVEMNTLVGARATPLRAIIVGLAVRLTSVHS